jgi:hypothetical protein
MLLFAVLFPVADLRFVAFVATEATPFQTLPPIRSFIGVLPVLNLLS